MSRIELLIYGKPGLTVGWTAFSQEKTEVVMLKVMRSCEGTKLQTGLHDTEAKSKNDHLGHRSKQAGRDQKSWFLGLGEKSENGRRVGARSG